MSFKREGNDKGLLDNLRKRRVNELLGEDIPEDEAKLLCNGRLACLVCQHNPVFDTVNMLREHRKHKMHAANGAGFRERKKELQALIAKRKHEQYMKDGTTTIKQAAATSSGGILSHQPYDPRVKKRKVKPYDRKPRLDLHSEPASSLPSATSGACGADTFSSAVPKKHNHQLKNIFRPSSTNHEPAKPYVRQNRTFTDIYHTSCEASDKNSSQKITSVDRQYSETAMSSAHSDCAKTPTAAFCGVGASGSQSTHPAAFCRQPSGSLCSANSRRGIKGKISAACVSHTVGSKSSGGEAGSSGPTDNTGKMTLSQKYYQLSGSGWKKDWDGKWIRDEDAEFDSDEEPPDLP